MNMNFYFDCGKFLEPSQSLVAIAHCLHQKENICFLHRSIASLHFVTVFLCTLVCILYPPF